MTREQTGLEPQQRYCKASWDACCSPQCVLLLRSSTLRRSSCSPSSYKLVLKNRAGADYSQVAVSDLLHNLPSSSMLCSRTCPDLRIQTHNSEPRSISLHRRGETHSYRKNANPCCPTRALLFFSYTGYRTPTD